MATSDGTRTSCMPGMPSTTELYPSPVFHFLLWDNISTSGEGQPFDSFYIAQEILNLNSGRRKLFWEFPCLNFPSSLDYDLHHQAWLFCFLSLNQLLFSASPMELHWGIYSFSYSWPCWGLPLWQASGGMYETPTQFLRLVHKGTNSPRVSPAWPALCQYVLVLFFLKV